MSSGMQNWVLVIAVYPITCRHAYIHTHHCRQCINSHNFQIHLG